MNGENLQQVSSYLEYLPGYFQEQAFLGRFLLAFEQILSGGINSNEETSNHQKTQIIDSSTVIPPGFAEILDEIDSYFIPQNFQGSLQQSPTEFLPWLASWVALTLREDWKEDAKRAFISHIVPLYQLRGTKPGLEQILALYMKNSGFPDKVHINDDFPDYPHYFQVKVTLSTANPEDYARQQHIAQAIINKEKPAHTYYALQILVPTMRITTQNKDYRLQICSFDGTELKGNTVIGTTSP